MVDFNLKELFTPHPKKEDTSKRIWFWKKVIYRISPRVSDFDERYKFTK
jgi:hypothetical protein